jgi:RNA polymerase sigma factor (sigma-70 family)
MPASNPSAVAHIPSDSVEWGHLSRLIRRELTKENLPSGAIDDLTQQVFLELVRKQCSPSRLRGLAVVVARRRRIDWLRKAGPDALCEAMIYQLDEHPARPAVSDLTIDLFEAMDRMSPEMREVFYACGIEERTRDEAAEYLGFTLHKVRVLYTQAIRIVADILDLDRSEEQQPRARNTVSNDSIS